MPVPLELAAGWWFASDRRHSSVAFNAVHRWSHKQGLAGMRRPQACSREFKSQETIILWQVAIARTIAITLFPGRTPTPSVPRSSHCLLRPHRPQRARWSVASATHSQGNASVTAEFVISYAPPPASSRIPGVRIGCCRIGERRRDASPRFGGKLVPSPGSRRLSGYESASTRSASNTGSEIDHGIT